MDMYEHMKELAERNPWLRPAAYLATSVFLLICMGFRALPIACCLFSVFLGVSVANWVANDSNGRLLYTLVHAWVTKCSKEDGFYRPTISPRDMHRSVPWKELKVPASVNDAAESLLDQVIDTYVNNWYESGISRDRDFLNEIRYQIRFACSRLVSMGMTLDLPSIIAEDVVPLAALHVHRIMKLEDRMSEKSYSRSLMETSICEAFRDLHFCLGSRQNEMDYLRQLADLLIAKLLDDTHLAGRDHDDECPTSFGEQTKISAWPSQSVRHFMRELVVNTLLLPCMDLLADPDTVNHLLIMAFDPQKSEDGYRSDNDNKQDVVFLTNFTEHFNQSVPDSLLHLKLSEVLRDARQYSTFRLYLQDTHGPVNELCFLAEASRIHDSMQRKAESSGQIAYDIWQLFGQFVHDSAPERIEFSPEIVQEFKAAVECNNLHLLDKVIETSYQLVYQRMQNEHLVPFCQSDSFLGYLCGSPPISVNELIDQKSIPRKQSVSGGTFSLAQFRSRLRKAIAVVSLDGSLDSEESLDDKLEEKLAVEEDALSYSSKSADSESVKDAVFDRKGSASSLRSNYSAQLTIPSIDVSIISDPNNISPASGYSVTDEDELSASAAAEELPDSEPTLVIDKDNRNINLWKVNVSRITPIRDNTTGRTIYAYVIEVERTEAKEKETKSWSIYRRFSEFYVLEMKLLEFHGDSLRFNLLPPRKPLITRNRAFLEQHRLLFSMFLSSLCKQKILHRSDLLFAFLTSSEEFRQNLLLSDLNPWKVVKKMPGKLGREKGQHLRPFLLTILANTLYAQEKVEFEEKVEVSDSSSLSSISMAADHYHATFYNPLFGNNCHGCKVAEESDGMNRRWTRSFTDGISLLLYSMIAGTSQLIWNLLSVLRMLCRHTIDSFMTHILRKTCGTLLKEQNLVMLLHFIQTAIFLSDGSVPSDQEKSLREELAIRRALEFAQEELPSPVLRMLDSKSWRGGIRKLIGTLQYPRLNKHLSYLMLDLLVTKLFSDCVT